MIKTEKEARKLDRYKRQLARPEYKGYFIILLGLIIAVHLLDSYISDVGGKVQSLYMEDLLIIGRGMSQAQALRFVNYLSILAYLFAIISPLYKSLMDKIGRRTIFIINLVGMAIGTFICYLSQSIFFFTIGLIFIFFFVIHDMQILYVFEVAPKKWRSTLYGATKFVGVLGTLAIPLLRSAFITETSRNWRPLYLVPAVVAFILVILSVFYLRESKVYLKNQIDYLRIPSEKRKKDNKGKDARKSGIGPAFKYVFGDQQLKWLSVTLMVFMTAVVAVVMYFEPFMKYSGMSDGQITKVLLVQPFIMAGMYLLCGVLADLIGRKRSVLVFCITCLLSAIGFVLFVWQGAAPWLIGVAFGLLISSYWNVSDIMGMMFAESAPTELRGSIMGVQGYIMFAGQAVSLLLYTILLFFLELGTIKILLSIPALVLAPVIMMIKVKETKGVSLETVGKMEEEIE